MPQRIEDDWSDSEDDGSFSEIESSVLLGIPDGDIDEPLDMSDPSVSRIGGHPAFLPILPLAPIHFLCKLCGHPMRLLVQMWCPFEESAMDRALYIWGCARPSCQRKDHSIRVWRGLKFNPKYATKLAKKKAMGAEKLAGKAADDVIKTQNKVKKGVNPFSLSPGTSPGVVIGLGTELFGSVGSADEKDDGSCQDSPVSESEWDGCEGESSVRSLTEQLKSTELRSAIFPTEWSSFPSYKPVYLSTISEYLPPPPKSKIKSDAFVDEDNVSAGRDWSLEGWEQPVDIDTLFEKFVQRVSGENEQCVRYDLKGTPLPFGSRDKVYDQLWPPPPPASFTTKPGFATPTMQRRTFNVSAVDGCEACGGPRVFECQLMPNLINVLVTQNEDAHESNETVDTTASPRPKEELKELLHTGMEWGTCFIFSCENDCYDEGQGGWREEVALVQWDE